MRKFRYILIIFAFMALLGIPGGGYLYGQVAGSPVNEKNAIDYRYQKFDGKLPRYADTVKFRDKIYTVFGAGVEANWERSQSFGSPLINFTSKATIGYTLTPVHAIEVDFLYSNVGSHPNYGANLNYVLNLTNFANRTATLNRTEVLLINGAAYRYADNQHFFGFNTGMRLQWNPGKNAGLYIEPRVSILSDPNSARKFSSIPSINMGLTLRFHKPDYYLWDYLTPIAIKTNLLYDAVTALNIGVEAPIGDRWSVVAEWTAPWWESYDKQLYFQLMHGNLEGKFWFGNREDKLHLTGWFAGVSVGGGVYDFMLNELKGIQGEFYTCSAVAGYAHPIDRSGNLRLEYELGLGWLNTEYVKYWWDGFDYTLLAPSPQTWVTNWYGPTKLQVSLVYYLKIRSKVGGRE